MRRSAICSIQASWRSARGSLLISSHAARSAAEGVILASDRMQEVAVAVKVTESSVASVGSYSE